MHTLFQLTLYTGQQLVLEGLHRWLQRPCHEVEQQRQRRTSLKSLIILLVKTAATGVLATVLDAAIEYRRRQLLAAAAADPSQEAALPSFGMLSRTGISAWKTRLLVCIDELERQAGCYGIEAKHRFSEGKPGDASGAAEKGSAGFGLPSINSIEQLTDEERQKTLAKTMEQLQSLVRDGGEDAEEELDREVSSLLDSLLGESTPATNPHRSSSSGRMAPAGGCAATEEAGLQATAAAAVVGSTADCMCQICMDRLVSVQVAGCKHDFCFQCARRLCTSQDHHVPQCPFCRQAIDGFSSC